MCIFVVAQTLLESKEKDTIWHVAQQIEGQAQMTWLRGTVAPNFCMA